MIPSNLPQNVVDDYFKAAYDPIMLQQIAPIYHLDNITAPVQIHIGTDDGASLVQTPPEWSDNLFLALLDANKDVEYYVYPNQGHFLRGQSWGQMMQRTADFFATHLIE